jgi:hypothetical protein
LFESLDIGLQELRKSLHSKCGDIAAILNSFDCELFEFKNVIELVLKLVEIDSVVLDTPSDFLLGFFNFVLISFVQNLEEVWIDLKVVLGKSKMFIRNVIFVQNIKELVSKIFNHVLNLHLLFVS